MPARVREVVNVFYSSNEIGAVDRRLVFQRTCRRLGAVLGLHINVIDWKTSIGGGVAATTGQDRIDEFVDGQYDIYFGCLGPGSAIGTIHEFEGAIGAYVAGTGPAEVLLGFDETPINPYLISDAFFDVVQFRREIGSSHKYGRAILYFTFSGEEEFEDRILTNLQQAIERASTYVAGGINIR